MKRLLAPLLAMCFPLAVLAKEAAPSPAPAEEERLRSLQPAQLEQAISALRERHISAPSLDKAGLDRAMLRGLLDELAPGVVLVGGKEAPPPAAPLRSEILEGNVGYVRLGSLSATNIAALDGALKDLASKKVDAAVIDLRATPESEDFASAARAASRFVPVGEKLFTLDGNGKAPREFVAEAVPTFNGFLVVVADGATGGAAEVLAAALRRHAKAMLVGSTTSGRAVEFESIDLGGGETLRFAVAQAKIGDMPPIYPGGLRPDVEVAQDAGIKASVLAGEEKGVASFVFEQERPRLNEASLVAGTNPEVDEEERDARSNAMDRPLQRAVDLVTAIRFFRSKPER